MNNLPSKLITDSAKATQIFFARYGQQGKEFKADDVAAVIGFFQSREFETDVAISAALEILKSAKQDKSSVFLLLDTLKEFNGVQLSVVVLKILNQNRLSISTLGFRSDAGITESITRNIRP
jgi:hypothetical protein